MQMQPPDFTQTYEPTHTCMDGIITWRMILPRNTPNEFAVLFWNAVQPVSNFVCCGIVCEMSVVEASGKSLTCLVIYMEKLHVYVGSRTVDNASGSREDGEYFVVDLIVKFLRKAEEPSAESGNGKRHAFAAAIFHDVCFPSQSCRT